jgi:glycosyltransferase involved in cell wall biosynthesis
MSATVIIPTTGSPELKDAVASVLNQTYPTKCYIVADGPTTHSKTRIITDDFLDRKMMERCFLPVNVGANGFYGHRIYAAFTHLIDTDYVLYLDQDCWFEPNHVESCIKTIEQNNLDWSYSLRGIHLKDGDFLCNDDCESLGNWPVFSGDYHHIDTNCYCIKTEVAIKLAQVWHGGWGQDRVFLSALSNHFTKWKCSGEYTVNYKVGGNEGSVKPEFFLHGNEVMRKKYNGDFPWKKK